MNKMKWHWQPAGDHVHVRVFMNGSLAGKLTFTAVEFSVLRAQHEGSTIEFVPEPATPDLV